MVSPLRLHWGKGACVLKCNSLTLADCLHRLEESVELILQLLLLLFLLFSFLALQLLKLDINISSHI